MAPYIVEKAREQQQRIENAARALARSAEAANRQRLTADYAEGIILGLMCGALAGVGIGWIIWGFA
jgi:F0F1-type ATP synthase assembly protein I